MRLIIIWYEGTSHRYTSVGTKVNVICKGQGQISRSHLSKNGLGVSQTHLVFFFPIPHLSSLSSVVVHVCYLHFALLLLYLSTCVDYISLQK